MDLVPEERLSDNIVGTDAYEVPPRPKKEFLPWHRPRKQLVRAWQWSEQIERLIKKMQLEVGTLRYLGLPGTDLLDLRYFYKNICEPRQLGLRFLGFNRDAAAGDDLQVELNISLDEVKKLELVDPLSDVIPDDFCRVADESSIAFKRVNSLGPFDVINLDLCDGFGKHAPGITDDTNYNAMAQLLGLQVHKKHPWLLLLTTRAGQSHVHAESLRKLVPKYEQNLTDCAEFLGASTEAFAIPDGTSMEQALKEPVGFLAVFLTSLCKWLTVLAMSTNPQCKTEVKSVIGYRVDHDCPCEDLISIALCFEPRPAKVIDPLGLVSQSPQSIDECKIAAQALRRVKNRVNADNILEQDQAVRKEMTNSTALLLEIARYEKDEYYKWITETEGWQFS
jgi:hypothetical protein